MRRLLLGVAVVVCGRAVYRFYASGAITIDSGVGRRVRELGPVTWEIAADRETVFEVIASPYLGKTPRSMRDHLEVWERGSDMVLAAHYTKVKCGVTTHGRDRPLRAPRSHQLPSRSGTCSSRPRVFRPGGGREGLDPHLGRRTRDRLRSTRRTLGRRRSALVGKGRPLVDEGNHQRGRAAVPARRLGASVGA